LFLGHVAAWALELEREQTEIRRGKEREGADTWLPRKEEQLPRKIT
jgi:hypothetical protein